VEPDPRIDAYIAKAAPFAQPVLHHIRALVHATVPGLAETIKWGMPHFVLNGKNLAGMAAFKAHCAFVIHGDGRQGDGGKRDSGQSDAMGQYGKIAALADLPPEATLKANLLEAARRIESAGTAVKKKAPPRAAKAEIPVPDDLAAALSDTARAVLDGFAPSHRREYLEWITEAKRPETRASRIAQATEWLAEGKKRNWKYEGC
jgi:uncharacterized protein YdeI (YjbR/CyaY-like superfamily)